MGTRGAYGFIIDGTKKIAYNHYDSYPSHLGKAIVAFVKGTPVEEMKEIARKIVLVLPDSKPNDLQIQKYKKYADLNVSEKSFSDWYCLLRNTQGDLTPYKAGLDVMIDNAAFLVDTLFCEYAYVINLDTGVLAIYTGRKDMKSIGFKLDDIPETWEKEVEIFESEEE